mmetsp:Transcript_47175/g.57115  ORF Transcript_47175/g.57115 Transcript_47175/m.57115 type:complete len:83 (+) Transcript_47175:1118-1366(+)
MIKLSFRNAINMRKNSIPHHDTNDITYKTGSSIAETHYQWHGGLNSSFFLGRYYSTNVSVKGNENNFIGTYIKDVLMMVARY